MAKQISEKHKVDFTLFAPDAQNVLVAGSFTNWERAPVTLSKQKNGLWKKTLTLPPGTYEYRLLVDGQWRDDPDCSQRVPNGQGSQNCIRVVS